MLSRVFQSCCHTIPLHVKRQNESEADVTRLGLANSSSSTCPTGFHYDQGSSACKGNILLSLPFESFLISSPRKQEMVHFENSLYRGNDSQGFLHFHSRNNKSFSRIFTDIDECLVNKNVCPNESRCINKEGGYECTKTRLQRAETTINCGPGFAYNRHLQECLGRLGPIVWGSSEFGETQLAR